MAKNYVKLSYNPYDDNIKLEDSQGKKYNNNHGLFNGSFNESLHNIEEKFENMYQGFDEIEVSFTGREYEFKLFKEYITQIAS